MPNAPLASSADVFGHEPTAQTDPFLTQAEWEVKARLAALWTEDLIQLRDAQVLLATDFAMILPSAAWVKLREEQGGITEGVARAQALACDVLADRTAHLDADDEAAIEACHATRLHEEEGGEIETRQARGQVSEAQDAEAEAEGGRA